MCDTCGCGHDSFTVHTKNHKHDMNTNHSHAHEHHKEENIIVETGVLSKNDRLADKNRKYFIDKSILAYNLVSSPGSGKTTILEQLIKQNSTKNIYVIEGDQQTTNDADRIEKAGAKAIQINTGNGCHLDAHMIAHALESLQPEANSLLFIENVGNLVCPAMFDLGESKRVVISSTTEGEDKPLKYPDMFYKSHICIINKIDLLPYLDFNLEAFKQNALKINPSLEILEVSAKNLEGFNSLIEKLM